MEKLTAKSFERFPVWEFCNDDAAGECLVSPVRRIPVSDAGNRLIGCQLQLADGSSLAGFVGNLSTKSIRANEEFLTFSFFVGKETFHLARYHDVDADTRGSTALARKLGKTTKAVFPVRYDLSDSVSAGGAFTKGSLPAEPKKRLSSAARMKLVFDT